jgi:tryptophan synthase alpha chain
MQVLVKNGADVIELGVPFSDPMADGPVIAKSHERAVADGVSLRDVLALVKKFRQGNDTTAIVLMGYLNPIEVFGYQAFAKAAQESGVDGVLVVDMPPEEACDLKACLNNSGVDFIFLVAPTTTDKRLKSLANIASGFVYFVALKGVTGASCANAPTLANILALSSAYCSTNATSDEPTITASACSDTAFALLASLMPKPTPIGKSII